MDKKRIYISFDDISTYVKSGIDVYYKTISLVKIKGLDKDAPDNTNEAPAERISNEELFYIEIESEIQ